LVGIQYYYLISYYTTKIIKKPLTFRLHSEAFIRRKLVLSPSGSRQDEQPSRQENDRTQEWTELIAALAPIHGLLTFLADVNRLMVLRLRLYKGISIKNQCYRVSGGTGSISAVRYCSITESTPLLHEEDPWGQFGPKFQLQGFIPHHPFFLSKN